MIRIAIAAAVAALLLVGHAYAQSESDAAPDNKRSRAQVAQNRTSIVITPRRRQLPPDAKRHCEAWLEQEYRVSGTVIVPRQRCWWQ